MKKHILGTLICVTLICVIVASLSFSAFAATNANITDSTYYFSPVAAGAWVMTSGRYKTNTSSVYVMPEISPTGYTNARTLCRVGGALTNATTASAGYVRLITGEKSAIRNTVFQRGDYIADRGVLTWLSLSPGTYALVLKGVWSPDWGDFGPVKLV